LRLENLFSTNLLIHFFFEWMCSQVQQGVSGGEGKGETREEERRGRVRGETAHIS
jgi:hypothetical protein